MTVTKKKKASLTFKQEKFCQNKVKGKSQIDSFIGAYNTKNMNRNTIAVKACNMMKMDKIRIRIAELESKIEKKVTSAIAFTREDLLNQLEDIKNMCRDEAGVVEVDSANPDRLILKGINRTSAVREVRACIMEQSKLLGYDVKLTKELGDQDAWVKKMNRRSLIK